MCRKKQLRGCLIFGIGIGLFLGYTMESWFLSTVGGLGLICLGILLLRKN